MNLNILLAGLKLFGIGTPHTAKGATTHTQFLNGVRAIDCSYMVYQAVASAGYGSVLPNSVGNFSTTTLFTDYAAAATDTTKFSRFTPTQIAGGSLQPGDILLLTNRGGGGHTGIFYGYSSDTPPRPLFYNVGNSKGTIVSDAIRDGYTIQGALRPQASQYNAVTDITANSMLVDGAGLTIPPQAVTTQTSDPTLHYYEITQTTQTGSTQTGRLYDNGVLYTKDTQTGQEYWSVPTATDGTTEVTKFSNGIITTQTFTVDGTVDTTVPGSVALDAGVSADVKAAFDAWVAAGNDPANVPSDHIFLDQTRGDIQFNLSGVPESVVLIGETNANGTGGDVLTGGTGNDLIIGSKGDDKLQGGKGNDYMAGGAGNDTYIINTGDGNDTIEDKQGINKIIFNGKDVGVLIRQADGSFKSADGKISGVLQGGDLILTDAAGGQLTLNKNFTEGDFGISFKDADVALQPTYTAVGDPLIRTTNIAPGGQGTDWRITKSYNQQYGTDANGNQVVVSYDVDYFLVDTNGNPVEAGGPERADTLHGTSANDHLKGMKVTTSSTPPQGAVTTSSTEGQGVTASPSSTIMDSVAGHAMSVLFIASAACLRCCGRRETALGSLCICDLSIKQLQQYWRPLRSLMPAQSALSRVLMHN
jgi:hypothetical protein